MAIISHLRKSYLNSGRNHLITAVPRYLSLTELDRVLCYGRLTTQVTTVWPHLINSQKGDVEAIKTNIFT